ncbi:hypothetical protein CROQUDRAFT_102063 [Cronartium quercuum f. sp. fusiforme G11]|uniref:MFS transporter n=1 Tax=Cronartium quercuum f. sp. fusiforme G11 TaxID=708437 RepID=A0A9P6T684_9BASI|nr:hypothetical protein CROQUDRAFT_102063 [Cronartium quercuum f. sp. fusiforme G11]
MSRYFKRPITWVLLISNISQSLAFFVPLLYLPTFANTLGLTGGVYLGLFSGSSIIGQMLLGTLSDKWDVSWLIAASCLASSASIFGTWSDTEYYLLTL